MSRRDGLSRESIDAAVVHQPNAGGDLEATEWAELMLPPEWVRWAERADGSRVLQVHCRALLALTSQARTRDNLLRASRLCRCPLPVIDPEDCGD